MIHSVDTVEFHGLTEQINLANGHPENITSLHIEISKKYFEQLNSDTLDSTSAFTSLNGQFACNNKVSYHLLRLDRLSKVLAVVRRLTHHGSGRTTAAGATFRVPPLRFAVGLLLVICRAVV